MGEAKVRSEVLEARVNMLSQQLGQAESELRLLRKGLEELAKVVQMLPTLDLKLVAMARLQRDQIRGVPKLVGEGANADPDYDAYIKEALAEQAKETEVGKVAVVSEGPVEFGG